MKKSILMFLIMLTFGLLSLGAVDRALSGVYYIDPAGGTNTYTSFTAAINALNLEGVGTGGVTFNVTAGTTFTEKCPPITVSGTSSNSIVFQKSGEGTNPIIYAGIGTGASDAIVTLSGTDYLIWDGIDLSESVGNTTTTTTAEYGIYIKAASATDGAQYNIFRNCKIVLKKTVNSATKGIYQYYTQTPSNAAGANSYNEYNNVTVESAVKGIYLYGISATYPDINSVIRFCTIGSTSANNIGGAENSYGFLLYCQKDITVLNNEIRSITAIGAYSAYGIHSFYGLGNSNTFYNNKIHDIKVVNSTAEYPTYGIYLNEYTTGTNDFKIYNNMIYGLTHTYSGTASVAYLVYGIYVASGGTTNTYNLDFNSIRMNGCAYAGSACVYWTTSESRNKMRNNVLANFSLGNSTSYHVCLFATFDPYAFGNSGSISDNNLFYTDQALGGYLIKTAGYSFTTQTGISSWNQMTGNDWDSKIGNPQFISSSNLHINPSVYSPVESNGTYSTINWVTTDIDGDTRSAETFSGLPWPDKSAPDIGADEGNFIGFPPFEPPASFTATVSSSNQINLSASANVYGQDILVAWSTDNVFGTPGHQYYDYVHPISGGGNGLYSGPVADLPNHTNLTSGTTYYYRVWGYMIYDTYCYTSTYLSASATTPVASYPYSEGFETSNIDLIQLSGCYSQALVSGTNYWQANNSQTTFNRAPRTGNWNAILAHGSNTWLFKSYYFYGGQSYGLKMYSRQDIADTSNAYLKAAFGTSNNASAMTNIIINRTPLTNGEYQLITGEFTPSASGIYYIGICGYMNNLSNWISIDDISVESNYALTGIKTINSGGGGDYLSFTAAINDLNLKGVGVGGVTFNVAAGTTYTENCPAITATGTVSENITFQKSGAGVNPVIYSGSGTGSGDAIVTLYGTDYLVWDGIDLIDNVANTTAITTAEKGLWVRSASATNGAQHNVFKNFKITLNNIVNINTRGICQLYITGSTSSEGANSYNEYSNITIENSVHGIWLQGDFETYPDVNSVIRNCTIGGSSTNSIGGKDDSHGMYLYCQQNIEVNNNEIRNVTALSDIVNLGPLYGNMYVAYSAYGIYSNSGTGNNNRFYNNKIYNIKVVDSEGSSSVFGMYFYTGKSGTKDFKIYNNMIYGITHTYSGAAKSTCLVYGICAGYDNGINSFSADFNSIRLDSPSSASSSCIIWDSYSGINKMRNNILANYSVGNSVSYHVALCLGRSGNLGAPGSISDHNVLYIDQPLGGYIVSANTTNYTSLTGAGSWNAASGHDLHSSIYNPQFISTTDMHINPSVYTPVENRASYFDSAISWVTSDIDNDTRDTNYPDIGADEGWFNRLPDLLPPILFTATQHDINLINLSAQANTQGDSIMVVFNTTDVFGIPAVNNVYTAGNALSGGGIILYVGIAAGLPNHTGLHGETTYYYRVWSFRDYEKRVYSENYLTANASTALPIPLAPSNTEISRNNNNIILSWDAVTHSDLGIPINVDYYVIFKSDAPSQPFECIGYTLGDTTDFVDIAGASSSTRFYRIYSFLGRPEDLTDFISSRR